MKTWSNWTPSFTQKLTTNHYMKVSFNFIKCPTNFSWLLCFYSLNNFVFVLKTFKHIESMHFDQWFKGDFVVVVVCCCSHREVCYDSFAKGVKSYRHNYRFESNGSRLVYCSEILLPYMPFWHRLVLLFNGCSFVQLWFNYHFEYWLMRQCMHTSGLSQSNVNRWFSKCEFRSILWSTSHLFSCKNR